MSGYSPGFPTASVVIPTFNRVRDLEIVVEAVHSQIADLSSSCQVVVVDDGSSDGTGAWLDAHSADYGLTILRQNNVGPATARNRGARASDGSIVLFLGDDTVPQPGWLSGHLEAHRMTGVDRPTAVLGYTSFPPDWDSPFHRWINEYGAQFGYSIIENPTDVPFNFFYTSNISLPRSLFEDLEGFREDFPAAAWEDIEFAYRAVAAGMRIRYLPSARTIHNHRMEVPSFCVRQRKAGESAAIFAGLHPELRDFLGIPCIGGSRFRASLERPVLRLWIAAGEVIHGLAGDRPYRRLLDGHYLDGLAVGLEEAPQRAEV